MNGIDYKETTIDTKYREYLENRADEEGLDILYEEALKIDKEAMQNISRNDKKRIIRVLEIYKETGKTKTEQEIESKKNGLEFDYKLFITNMDREVLYDRINKRVDLMIEQGLIEEVKNILAKYEEIPTAMQALGYKETKEYLDGLITKPEMIEKIKQETRRYAKRQLTWFRKNENGAWLNMQDGIEENLKKIIKLSYT